MKNDLLNFNWINTLSYLVPMMDCSDLYEWLVEKAPDIIYQFETDKLYVDQRYQIFKNIIINYKQKNLWITHSFTDLQMFANYFACEEAVDFLLEEISQPMHFRSLANAIRALRHFRSLFGREREAAKVLITCCQDINTRPYEREAAIHAIGSLHLSSDYTNQILLELFHNTTNSYERAGMYAYFIESNQVDEFIDFFLNGITKKSISTGDSEYGSESFRLNEGLSRISKPYSIRKALDFFAQHEERIDLYKDRELVESIVSKTASLYLDGYNELYASVYNTLLTALKKHYHEYIKEFWSFFVRTGEKISDFQKIISIEDVRRNFYYEGLIDDDCITFMAEQYKNEEHKKFFIDIVESLTEDHPMFSTYQCLIQQTDNICVQPRKIVDYPKLEQQRRRRYFNALFDKEKYNELIYKLVAISESENPSYKELKDLHYLKTEDKYELDLVKWDLIRAIDDKDSHLSIKDFLARINWDGSSIYQIYKLLESHNRESVTISALQKEHIKKYCDRILSEITFSDSVTYCEDRGWSCTWDSFLVSFFIQYLDLPCDDKLLYDLLLYPGLYEFDEDGRFHLSYNNAMHFLEQRLSKEKLIAQVKHQVKHNVLNCQLSSPILERHLAYCKEHKISDASILLLYYGGHERARSNRKHSCMGYQTYQMHFE